MAETLRLLEQEVSRRRMFAIISHPDAGKTTRTEKPLLYGGCVEVAGAVRGRKTQRAAHSDWMELEKQPGISVNSTVLAFDFEGHRVNLLDTPGHHDFSEGTYRTLMAAEIVPAATLAGLSAHGARACEEADLLAGASPPCDQARGRWGELGSCGSCTRDRSSFHTPLTPSTPSPSSGPAMTRPGAAPPPESGEPTWTASGRRRDGRSS